MVVSSTIIQILFYNLVRPWCASTTGTENTQALKNLFYKATVQYLLFIGYLQMMKT